MWKKGESHAFLFFHVDCSGPHASRLQRAEINHEKALLGRRFPGFFLEHGGMNMTKKGSESPNPPSRGVQPTKREKWGVAYG